MLLANVADSWKQPFLSNPLSICHLGIYSTFKDHGRRYMNSVKTFIFCVLGITALLNPWIYQKVKYCSYAPYAGQTQIHKNSEK